MRRDSDSPALQPASTVLLCPPRFAGAPEGPVTGMQPTLNTVAETAGLFNLRPMVAINLHCIPTLVCRDAAKIYQTVFVINVRRPLVGWAAIRRNAPPVGSSSTTNARYSARAAYLTR